MKNNDHAERRLAHYEPSRYISPIQEMMDRFWNDDFFSLRPFALERELTRSIQFPKVDIKESEKDITITANVPGLSAENIDIEVGDDTVSISGKVEKESREGKEGEKFYRYEREYGAFRREFTLPTRVKKDGVEAKAKNGVLTLTLPKAEDDAKKRISVKDV